MNDPDNETIRDLIKDLASLIRYRFGTKYGLLICIKNHSTNTANTSWINMTKEDNIKALEKGLEKVQKQSVLPSQNTSTASYIKQLLPESDPNLLFPATVVSKAIN
jgi:hypothetical protein